jgi:hypothetical protein
MTGSEHDSALHRLEAALDEQDRSRAHYHAALGTSTELGAYIGLRAASKQVAARDAWLRCVDDEDFGSLGAGPFLHRADDAARVAPEAAD